MNFFAHAVVATRRGDDPRWILGSMAPDFASMAGLRIDSVTGDAPLERGVAFHHLSDDAFHGAPIFVELMENAREELERDGMDTGPAMAIGHVGVELLLDGVLVERGGVTPGYRAAIEEAAHVDMLMRFIGLDDAEARARWRILAQRMVDAPVPQRYTEPSFVADRLVRILSSRRRLAVPFGREPLVHAWARRAVPEVARRADALFEQVEARIVALGGAAA